MQGGDNPSPATSEESVIAQFDQGRATSLFVPALLLLLCATAHAGDVEPLPYDVTLLVEFDEGAESPELVDMIRYFLRDEVDDSVESSEFTATDAPVQE